MLQLEKYASAPGTPPANILNVYAREVGGLIRLFIKGPDGGEIALGVTVPIPVADGGTGATTAAAARANLGAAAAGANADITALSALATPLSIPQGGTGQTSAAAAYGALSPLSAKGDLQTRDGSAPARLPVGANGQVLTADSAQATGLKWAAVAGGGSAFAPSTALQLYDDFVSSNEDTDEIGVLNWRNYFAGTGNNSTRIAGELGHPGIFRLTPGTVETGRQCLCLGDPGSLAPIIKGGGEIVFETVVRLTLANLALHEMTVFGLGDVVNAVGDQANGIYFQILGGATPDANWYLVCANGGVRTRVDTGVAYVSGAWVRFKWTLNAAGTSVQANINGVDVGAPIATNLPAGAVIPLYKGDAITGGAATNLDIDYFFLQQSFTTAR